MQNRLLLILVIISIILGSSMLTRGHIWGDDFASYVMQAESILNGTTHTFVERNSFTIHESTYIIGPTAYPWGYPLILTPAYALKGNHPLALKLPGLFFYAGFLVCLYLLWRDRLTLTESLLLTALFAFNPVMFEALDTINSDIPFLFFATVVLLLIGRSSDRTLRDDVFLGCAMAAAFLIRTQGILLPVSFLVWKSIELWDHRKERDRITPSVKRTAVPLLTFSALWILFALLFPGGNESYLDQYRLFDLGTALGYITGYFYLFGQFFGENWAWQIVYYILFVFFLLGAWSRRREDTFFMIFFALWMLLLITWPSWQGPRFIFPVLPLFVYFIFQGMKFGLAKLPTRHFGAAQNSLYGFWLAIAAIFLINAGVRAYNNLKNERVINGPYDAVSREVYDYIRDETPTESVVVFFKPRAMRLMTNRDSFLSTDCAGILKGDFLVLSRKVGENLQIPPEQIDSCGLPLNQVFKNNRFIVYEIEK